MIFKILTVIFSISLIFSLSQAQVDEPCIVRHNGARGVCKVDRSCPRVQADAQRGIQPTICGILDSMIYIVCCEGAKVSNIQPNTLTNVHNEGGSIIFTDDDSDEEPNLLSISETKCLEYNKNTFERVEVIPLLPDAKPSGIVNSKCKYDSIPLVVNGEAAKPGEFPFMALLGYPGDGDIRWQCGGTLISDRYVMTAAHCTVTRSGQPIVVRLGELDLSTENDTAAPKDFKISYIINHPNYSALTTLNDIALIKLSEKVEFNNFVRPACLLNKNKNGRFTSAIATGWGLTENFGSPSDILQKVSLPVLDKSVCDRTFSNIKHYRHGLPNTIICAGDLGGERDTCQGDSGGPLTVTKKDNQCIHYAVGITSFGRQCALKNTPAVYTKVSEFVPWIEEVVWK